MRDDKDLPNKYGYTPRRDVAPFIPASARRLLDVGCNMGGFGEALKAQRQIEVWGIEPNAEAAARAAMVLDRLFCEFFDEQTSAPDGQFDVVVFNDVLEHLVDPWAALALAKRKLGPGGCVVASIPNVLHKDNLLHLLVERDFRYEKIGVRDKTHLRFFTRKSACAMFVDSGFRVDTVQGINEDWWAPDLRTRLAYRLFPKQLEETKYIQYVVVGRPHDNA